MRVPFVDLRAQYEGIRQEIERSVLATIERADFILGEELRRFEGDFARFCGVRFAVGVGSGTEALELAMRACGVGAGDEVITAANTYMATVEAIWRVGATPVLVDVSARNHTIDIAEIERFLTARTRAIVPVHLYGQSADMASILEIGRKYDLKVIEDACQAHGARYNGRTVGSLGDIGCFSFYPSKNLGAYGDGGMIVTNNEGYADKIALFRNHGQREKYHHVVKGTNGRLDTLQAAVLRVKLAHLEEWNTARRRHAKYYGELLERIGLRGPHVEGYGEHVYHLYVIEVEDRDRLRAFLGQQGVETGIHYPIPVHRQKAFRDSHPGSREYPVTDALSGRIISLPLYAELDDGQIRYVVEMIARFYGR